MLVALRMFMARSASVLCDCGHLHGPWQGSLGLSGLPTHGGCNRSMRAGFRGTRAQGAQSQGESRVRTARAITRESAGRREDKRRSRSAEKQVHVERNDVGGKLAPVSLGDA